VKVNVSHRRGGSRRAEQGSGWEAEAVARVIAERRRNRPSSSSCRGRQLQPVEGDPAWLEQVVENLVSNAIKYSTEGGRVEVRTTADAGPAVLEVTDSGIRIPTAEQP
jgi:signal transduction histidine kinase